MLFLHRIYYCTYYNIAFAVVQRILFIYVYFNCQTSSVDGRKSSKKTRFGRLCVHLGRLGGTTCGGTVFEVGCKKWSYLDHIWYSSWWINPSRLCFSFVNESWKNIRSHTIPLMLNTPLIRATIHWSQTFPTIGLHILWCLTLGERDYLGLSSSWGIKDLGIMSPHVWYTSPIYICPLVI